MYGNFASPAYSSDCCRDKPQHIMYGNVFPPVFDFFPRVDKPQHIMYGNVQSAGVRRA